MRKYIQYHYTSDYLTPFPETELWEQHKVDKKNRRIHRENQHFSLRIHGGNRKKNPARRRRAWVIR